mmetsp:Transcript_4402/g.10594  ORF Transcript_4402/g.10594 Transcript_4402/m.10594 type:complete len:638 (-) Transcript_4402:126-2039(-)
MMCRSHGWKALHLLLLGATTSAHLCFPLNSVGQTNARPAGGAMAFMSGGMGLSLRLGAGRSVGGVQGICMQQNRKKKKPKKRSDRGDPFAVQIDRPVGAAKRKLVLKDEEDQALRLDDWVELRKKVIKERERDGFPLDGGWAGDKGELKKKMVLWNADKPSDQEEVEGEMLVTDTNLPMWKQVTEPTTGDVYFWNLETEDTVWEIPKGVVLQEKLSDFRGITKTIQDPTDLPGSKWMCTQTTSGHAHYGIFFDVEAKASDVYITAIRTASHFRSDIFEGRYRILIRDGTGLGHEFSKTGWRQVGYKEVKGEMRVVGPKKWDSMGLPREIKTCAGGIFKLLPAITSEDLDPEVIYGSIALAEAIKVPAGKTVGMVVWSDDSLGIVLRKKDVWMNQGRYRTRRWEGGFFDKGEVTDENADIALKAGLVPRKDIFRGVASEAGYSAFTGVLQYTLDQKNVPEMDELPPEAMDVMLEGVENLNADGDEDVVVPTTAQDALNAFEAKEAAAQAGDVEGEDEQDEMDAETLSQGPADSFFGGAPTKGAGGAKGALTLAVFLGDSEAGEVKAAPGMGWEALQTAISKLSGLPVGSFAVGFSSPEGNGASIAISDAGEWNDACKDFLFNPEYDLDGYLDLDIIPN